MVDVHEGLPKDGFAVPLRLHNLLLALAGRLDDSALSEARELVARSHPDDAAELVVGSLIAGRIMVRPSEQRELAVVLELSRSDTALADQLAVSESVPGHTHRFTSDNDPEAGIVKALDRTLQVLPDLRSVHAVWRNTPAGSVPGPLPQRVVLIEVGPEAHPPAVAFRVDDALRRSGIRAVVEVTGPNAERTEYHEAALAAATPVWLASDKPGPAADGSASRSSRKITAGAARAQAEFARRPSHAIEEPPRFSDPEPVSVEVPSARAGSPLPAPEQVDTAEPTVQAGHIEPHSESAPVEPVPAESAEPSERSTEKPDKKSFSAEELAQLENRVAETTEMSPEEMAQLRAAIAEDPEKGRKIAGLDTGMTSLPELDLDDPQLSERDRQLLRELHAELAERERAEAAKANGVERS
ncbi:hypothetical protein [Saccharomonospora sp.]|uniref:hypothetical protein n=1 Tax=Saccharomonospora sp. TaxID=33913 RepID=UPI0026110360|nr:hypothetical protein [Saccharomonospora sp.]